MTHVFEFLRASALPTALAASMLACAIDPEVDPAAADRGAEARQELPPPVVVDVDDPSCGLPESADDLLRVAHAGGIDGIARVGNRVLSQDERRWVLWDVETRKAIASGPVRVNFRVADLAAGVALTPSADGRDLDVRSAEDGRVTARIPLADASQGTRGLARDGSYVYVVTNRSLRVFDPSGRLLFEQPGDYTQIRVHAGPTELRVGHAASPSIETFSLQGERRLAMSFSGWFGAWFVDGEHFTTSSSDGVRVFRADGALVRFVPHRFPLDLEGARVATAGDGPFLWIQDPYEIDRYRGLRITDGSAIESVVGNLVSGPNLARVAFAQPHAVRVGQLRIMEVTPGSSYPRERRVPADDFVSAYSVDAAGNWASGGYRGEVYVSRKDASARPLPLGCASPLAIAGARDRVAVLTSDGRIRVFDLVDGKRRWLRTLDVFDDAYTAELAFAGDGRYLVAHRRWRGDLLDRAPIDVFDLAQQQPGEPAASVVLRYGTDREYLNFVVTPHGEHIAIQACDGMGSTGKLPACDVHVSKLDGSMHWKTPPLPGVESLSLHPKGDRVAVTTQPYVPGKAWFQMPLQAQLFDAQKGLVLTVPDTAVGTFLDDARLLVHSELSVRVIGLDGETLASPAGKLQVDWAQVYSEDPSYFFQRAYVHRADDASIVWRPTALLQPITPADEARTNRITGFALVGDRVAIGVDDYVKLERYR